MTQSTKPPPARSRREKILTVGLISAGIILIVFFGFRAVRSFLRLQLTSLEPGVTDVELIRGWMTVPYLATAYGVPEDYIFAKIGVPQAGNQNKSLYHLNRDYFGGQPEAVLKVVQAAIKDYHAKYPPPSEVDHD